MNSAEAWLIIPGAEKAWVVFDLPKWIKKKRVSACGSETAPSGEPCWKMVLFPKLYKSSN